MFTGTQAGQPFLDYALLNLIADAPTGAKVDDSIDKKNITFLDLKLFDLDFAILLILNSSYHLISF